MFSLSSGFSHSAELVSVVLRVIQVVCADSSLLFIAEQGSGEVLRLFTHLPVDGRWVASSGYTLAELQFSHAVSSTGVGSLSLSAGRGIVIAACGFCFSQMTDD